MPDVYLFFIHMVVQASLFQTLDRFRWCLVSNLRQSFQNRLEYSLPSVSYPVPCPACLPLIISNAGEAHCTILDILLCFDSPCSCFNGPRSQFDRPHLQFSGPYSRFHSLHWAFHLVRYKRQGVVNTL